MQYNNLANQRVYINDRELNSGGQGKIHKVLNSNSVAKIYIGLDNKKKQELNKKIRYMVSNPPFDGFTPKAIKDSMAWPTDVLFDNSGFAGFIMPFFAESIELSKVIYQNKRFNNNKIVQKFSPLNQTDYFLQRLIICYNLASVLRTIHQRNQYVIVDLKPDNILINISGIIVLIDIDSIQVAAFNQLYNASAITQEYAPPEYHNNKVSQRVKISASWDYFAFALIAYELLFLLPAFVGTVDGHTTLVENVAKNYFPHGKHKNKFRIIPHPHQKFQALSSGMKKAFIDTFDSHPMNRANFQTWVDCLYHQIRQVATIKAHKDFSKLNAHVKNLWLVLRQLFFAIASHNLAKKSAVFFAIVILATFIYTYESLQKPSQVVVYESIFNLEHSIVISQRQVGKLIATQIINGIQWQQHMIEYEQGTKLVWIKKSDL